MNLSTMRLLERSDMLVLQAHSEAVDTKKVSRLTWSALERLTSLSRSSVRDATRRLIEAGYLTPHMPDKRGRARGYVVFSKKDHKQFD